MEFEKKQYDEVSFAEKKMFAGATFLLMFVPQVRKLLSRNVLQVSNFSTAGRQRSNE